MRSSATFGSDVASRWAVNSAAVTSPEPFAFIGSSGVCTIQAVSPCTASISTVSSGASGRNTLVTSTVEGPMVRAASTDAIVSSRVCGSVSVR